MSTFEDFRKVWEQRFPGSELPSDWVADVRANLSKHKQKVRALQDELDREQTYVEYLERLLRERHEPESNGEAVEEQQPQPKKELMPEDAALKIICELSRTLAKIENGDADEQPEETVKKGRAMSDASHYVTVIEVNEADPRALRKAQSVIEGEKPKKVPPKPPPKTFRMDIKAFENECNEEEDGPVEAEETEEEATTRQLVEAADLIAASVKDEDDGSSSKSANVDEPLYDQVPMDAEGDYVYLATMAAGLDRKGHESGGSMSDLDGEATMKSRASGTSACSSETGTTDTDPGILTSSPGSPCISNYVNIDYFIKQNNAEAMERTGTGGSRRNDSAESDEDVPPLMRTISHDTEDAEDGREKYASNSSLDVVAPSNWRPESKASSRDTTSTSRSNVSNEKSSTRKCIIANIIESETAFLGGLGALYQYMKAVKATLGTSQPVISQSDFNTIFFKVPELYNMHRKFLDGLKRSYESDSEIPCVGEHFKSLALQINEYGAFLHNYGRATDAVRKCVQNSSQFAQIMHSIPVRSERGRMNEQKASLEDLLHKPVARIQKNALVLNDLIKYTPETNPDHQTLGEALAMNQSFLDEFNMIQTKSMFPSADRAQRRLVKNSFIVELADGHRKLRHLFLFNDVIACAKYKASGRDKFTFELKWYIPLSDILVYDEFAAEPKEASPASIVALKSAACTVRDQILWQERQLDVKRHGARAEKQRKKLADLEAQLVLASPNLVFRVGQRNQRSYTFFLSSEFERTQWIDAIQAMQTSQFPGPSTPVGMNELQAWITACRTFLKTDMGSYLLRSGRDESLLLGDLHVKVCRLRGLEAPANLLVCLEVDSYGHYFKKARTKLVCGSASPVWDEEFVVELEGSQNLRVLLYEETGPRAVLRGRATQMLSHSWLGRQSSLRTVSMQNYELDLMVRFVPSEETLRRVPTAKVSGLFGAKIQQVCKRQKRPVPFIITSCVREVERRGMDEVGIYRVSGSASDLSKLKKSFETNSYEAEQLLKEVDIHSVTGILKLYLRELPEALFTDALYPKLFEIINSSEMDASSKRQNLITMFRQLSSQNQQIVLFLLAHMSKVNQQEHVNKMSLHNLATVFGPTLLRPCSNSNQQHRDPLAAGTVDVMAQAGILYQYLQCFVSGELRTLMPPPPGLPSQRS
ncbi:active breakpoint cluster region-related protein [Cloeon dipterum]|uniref:active breakpoint cluster region-related protein n=1 Tax=Cloeon dipterum TaxID=197152 RepID=UPI00321FA6DF